MILVVCQLSCDIVIWMNRLNSRDDLVIVMKRIIKIRWSRELGWMAVNNGWGLGISPGYYECHPRQLSYTKQRENRTKRTS